MYELSMFEIGIKLTYLCKIALTSTLNNTMDYFRVRVRHYEVWCFSRQVGKGYLSCGTRAQHFEVVGTTGSLSWIMNTPLFFFSFVALPPGRAWQKIIGKHCINVCYCKNSLKLKVRKSSLDLGPYCHLSAGRLFQRWHHRKKGWP